MLKREFRPVMREVSMDVRGIPRINTRPGSTSPPTVDTAGHRHPTLTVAIHWITAVAIVVAVAAMFVRDAVEDRLWRQILLETHRQLGLLVLLAAAARITLRLRKGLTDHAPDMATLLRWTAKAAHFVMYGVLIALPLLGWAVTSAHGVSLKFLVERPTPQNRVSRLRAGRHIDRLPRVAGVGTPGPGRSPCQCRRLASFCTQRYSPASDVAEEGAQRTPNPVNRPPGCRAPKT